MDRLSDWVNPILVKEARQSLKSRQFVVTFMLLLAASWLISLFGMLLGGAEIEFGAVGTHFFQLYFYILSFAVMVIIPFGCYRSLLAEREQTTYELLSITALSPRQVIWGKLLSAGLQLFIFYSAITPFIAFTSLLQGFDIAQVAYLLVTALFASLLASMAALMVSSMVKQGVWQAIVSMIVLAGLLLAFFITVPLTAETQYWFDARSSEFWWTTGLMWLGAASYFALFQQIATAQMTFESDNRASGVRLVCALQVVLLWGSAFALVVWWTSTSGALSDLDDMVVACSAIAGLHWSAVGLFVVTEDQHLSHRIQRRLPGNPLLRLFLVPWLPGGNRGMIYMLLNIGLLVGIGLLLSTQVLTSQPEVASFVWCLGCYLVAYLGVACGLARWCGRLSHDIRPGHTRVLTLILLAIGCIGPYIPILFGANFNQSYHPIMITNPLVTLVHVVDRPTHSSLIVPIVTGMAALCLLVNLPAMHRGIREVVFAARRGTKKPAE